MQQRGGQARLGNILKKWREGPEGNPAPSLQANYQADFGGRGRWRLR
jgi:hypothetical protein